MGEMADLALEETMIMEDLRDQYHDRNMSLEDAYEVGIVNELGIEEEP